MVTLSRRLQAIADLISPTALVADIGCDHGFLAIYLIQQRIAGHVIAADINSGPLRRCMDHVMENGLQNCITTIQTDGLTGLPACNAIVIAGMGGFLMYRILTDSPDVTGAANELILQPQSELAQFRQNLTEMGYCITEENFIIEDGKYYPMMKAVKGSMHLTPLECLYGPILLRMRNKNLHSFLLFEREQKLAVREQLINAGTDNSTRRLAELDSELQMNEEALKMWEITT